MCATTTLLEQLLLTAEPTPQACELLLIGTLSYNSPGLHICWDCCFSVHVCFL